MSNSTDALALDWRSTAELTDNSAASHLLVSGVTRAFDRSSVRQLDHDGRLHVSSSHISKANICPYLGKEIPGFEELGLDPAKTYQLLRHPDELARPETIASFNNLPILSDHVPVTPDKPEQKLVIGSTGTDASFNAPFLDNSLVFWTKPAIDDIEDDERKELSCAYKYSPDMTPGEYEGVPYDGVMRDIRGNHVALVKQGRAGADVVVGDSMEGLLMHTKLSPAAIYAKGALTNYLRPRLAMDAKLDLDTVLAPVTGRNYKDQKPIIESALRRLVRGKLAQDADVEDLPEKLDEVEDDLDASSGIPAEAHENDLIEGEDAEYDCQMDSRADDARMKLGRDETDEERDAREERESAADARMKLGRDETDEEAMDRRKRVMDSRTRRSARDKKRADDAKMRLGRDETDEEAAERRERERAEDRKGMKRGASTRRAKDEPPRFQGKPEVGEGPEPVTKEAMDAAIARAVAETQASARDTQRALVDVQPWTGALTLAFDSAESVYKHALKVTGVKVDPTWSLSAMRAILDAQPRPGARSQPRETTTVAMDAAGAAAFGQRFPSASKIARA